MSDLTITQAIVPALADTDFPSVEQDTSKHEGEFLADTKKQWKFHDAEDLRTKIHKGCLLTMVRNHYYREFEPDDTTAEKETRKFWRELEVAPKEAQNLMDLYAVAAYILREKLMTPAEIYTTFTSKSLMILAKAGSEEIWHYVLSEIQNDYEVDGKQISVATLTKTAKIMCSDLPNEILELLDTGNIRKHDLATFVDAIAEIPEADQQLAIEQVTEAQQVGGLDGKALKRIGKNARSLQEIRDYFNQLFSDDLSRQTIDLDYALGEIQNSEDLEPIDLAKFLKSLVNCKGKITSESLKLSRISETSDKLFTKTGSGSHLRLMLDRLEGVIVPREQENRKLINFPLDDQGTKEITLTLTSNK